MRAFVTGANGFIGSNLVRRLIAEEWQVTGLARRGADLSFLDGVKLDLVCGDLSDPDAVAGFTEGADVLFHIAGLSSDWGPYRDFHAANVTGTGNCLAAARATGVRRFVHLSSASLHGFAGYRDLDETAPTPPSRFHYVETKRLGEDLVRAAGAEGGLEIVVLRPGNVYGPFDRVTSLPMLSAMETGWMGTIDGGRHLTCPTYVDNLVDAILLAARETSAVGEVFLVTDGLDITWQGFLRELAAALEVKPPRLSLPRWFVWGLGAVLEGLFAMVRSRRPPPLTRYRAANAGRDYHFSVDRLRQRLGWEPRVDLTEACRRTVEWYRASRTRDAVRQ